MCYNKKPTYLNTERVELPFGLTSETGHVDTFRDVDGLSQLIDILQRTLNTVEDTAQDTWTQLYRERLACTQDGISDRHAGRFFVYLRSFYNVYKLCFRHKH